jgi:hypothetical protein
MAAVTIHLPEDVESDVKKASAAAGKSVSAWLTEAARKQLQERLPPPELVKLFGSVPDFELPTRKERWSKDEP